MVIAKNLSHTDQTPIAIQRIDHDGNPQPVAVDDKNLEVTLEGIPQADKIGSSVLIHDTNDEDENVLYIAKGTKGEAVLVNARLEFEGAVLTGGASVTYVNGGDEKLQILLYP